MNTLRPIGLVLSSLLFWGTSKSPAAQSNETADVPDFQEVHRLVRENLKGVSDEELNRAAVLGFLNQLYPRVSLVTNTLDQAKAADDPLVSNTAVFEESYGYLRVSAIRSGLSEQVEAAIGELESKNKLKGLILDLRFASGRDYAVAAEVADLFLPTERLLLKWGHSWARSTTKTNSIELPVAMLVNRGTIGAAEALTAVLQETHASLTIGAPTAGDAHVYEEFELRNGHRIRVAADSVEVGDGQQFPDKGLTPDILVEVEENQERAFLADPYLPSGPRLTGSATENDGGNGIDPIPSENRLEPVPFHESTPARRGESPALIGDPVLARAIDFLKGLALLGGRR